MLRSMTGFGSASLVEANHSYRIEIRAINSKSSDFSFRIPKSILDKELEIKNHTQKILDRGKVSLVIENQVLENAIKPKLKINKAMLEAYCKDIAEA